MKNKLIIICAILCSFLFIDKANAITEEKTTTYAIDFYSDIFKERFESDLSKTNLDLDQVDNKLKEDYDLLKNTYPYYMSIVSCNVSTSCDMVVYYFSNKPNIAFTNYQKSSSSSIFHGYKNNSNNSIDFVYKSFSFGSGYPNSSTSFNNFTTLSLNTKSVAKNDWISYHFNSNTSYKNYTYSFNFPAQILYDTNLDIKKIDYNSSGVTNYDTKFGNYYYQANDIIPTYKDILNPTPKTYTFDGIIHDNEISQAYFDLDLQQLQNQDYNLNLKYAYGNYTSNILAPYLKITYYDNTNSYISIVTDEKPILNVFMGSFEICLDNSKSISNVQVVFPMENINDIDYKIQLESNVNFEISYLYDEVFNSYLQTVDITGKYSVMLIPRLVEYNSDAFQDFYLTGDNYEIRILYHIDTSDITSALKYVYRNWNRPTFRYFEGVNQVTNAIQFINNEYIDLPNKQYTVTFDSRYWTYYIADKYNSTVTVTNPNTGVTNDLNFEDITNNIAKDIYGNDLNSYLDYINDSFKNNDSDSPNSFFANLLVIIYDSAPGRLSIIFRIFLILTFIGCLVYVMGWK